MMKLVEQPAGLLKENKSVVVDNSNYEEKLIVKSVLTFEEMMKNCPDPTRKELVKMLAIQGHFQQQFGLEMLAEASKVGCKGREKKMLVAMKALAQSRQAIESSLGNMAAEEAENDVG